MGSEIIVIPAVFIALPWLILHYVTRWKMAKTLTGEDEKLMEDLYDLSRRFEDRLNTVERIVSTENPAWRSLANDPISTGLESRSDTENLRRIK